MADEAVFTTYNITDEQDVTPEIRKKAADFYDQAFQHNWEQDNKTEWITANGAPMDKPADLTDWQFSGAGAGMGNFGTIPRYADLNNLLDEQRTFFANASDEDIRKALKPPNDMGKFAQKAYADMLKEKNYQDNLFTQGQLPDTDVRKANEIIQEKEAKASEDEKKARQEALLKAAAEAEKQKNAAIASVQPAKSIEFKQQNFLQAKMLDIVKHRHRVIEFDPERQKKYPYQEGSPNSSIMLHGDPATCINDLLIYQDTETFFQMGSEEIANLQPEIRFFKVIPNAETKKDENVEIAFDTNLTTKSLDSLLQNRKKRGTGVGIREFKISFVGTDVFAANKSFKASLKLFANSFEELFVPRGEPGRRYRYIDLALKTGKNMNDAIKQTMNAQKAGSFSEDLARLDYSIKVKVGLREPKTAVSQTQSSLKGAVGRNSLTLHLTPTVHSFNFNPDGSIEFEMEFLPFNNQRFSGANFDIFTNSNVAKMDFELKTKTKLYRKNCETEKLDALKKEQMKKIKEARLDAIASIIGNLHSAKKVNYLQVHPEVLEKFTNNAAELSFEEILKLSENAEFVGNEGKPDGLEDDINKDVGNTKPKPRIKSKVNSPTINTIPYVFISDIIDVVLAAVTKSISSVELSNLMDITLAVRQQQLQELQDGIRQTEKAYVRAAMDAVYGIDFDLEAAEAGTLTRPDAAADTASRLESVREKKLTSKAELEEEIKLTQELIEDYKKDFEDFRKFRVVLGPVELVNPFDQNDVVIASLGDIPIALPYLQEWLTSETLKNNSRRMPVSSFLNKLMNKLVKSALNDDSSFGGALKQKVRLAKTEAMCINQYADKTDDLTYLMHQTNKILEKNYDVYIKNATGHTIDDWSQAAIVDKLTTANAAISPHTSRAYLNHLSTPVLECSAFGEDPTKKDASEKEMNYLIFYAARANLIGFYRGDRLADSQRGVHHYSVGRDRGIIKEIKLTRDSRKGVREARFEQEGFDGLQQLREVYSVDVDCYANFNVFPGTKIFVDPRGWVPNLDSESLSQLGSVAALTDFGIGGYYDVMQVDHTFGAGQFDTTFKAKWTAQIDSPRRKNKDAGKPSEKNVSKCKSAEQTGNAGLSEERFKGPPGNELAQLASRTKALAVSGFEKMLAGSEGLIDRAAAFFGKPSDAP